VFPLYTVYLYVLIGGKEYSDPNLKMTPVHDSKLWALTSMAGFALAVNVGSFPTRTAREDDDDRDSNDPSIEQGSNSASGCIRGRIGSWWD